MLGPQHGIGRAIGLPSALGLTWGAAMPNKSPSAEASAGPSIYRAMVWRSAATSAGYALPACDGWRTGCSANWSWPLGAHAFEGLVLQEAGAG